VFTRLSAHGSVLVIVDQPASIGAGYRYYTDVKERYDANRAALSQARRIVRQAVHILTPLGEDALTTIN